MKDLVFVSESKADELLPNNAHPGDLVFTQRGTLGQVGLIPRNSPFSRFVISQSQMKLTVDEEKADTAFLYYYFRMPKTVQQIHNLAFSTGVPHINLDILRNFEVRLPPLLGQKRIRVILSTYDDLIENNTRRIRILEKMAQAIYREWFVHFRFPGHKKVKLVPSPLGPIPEKWEVRELEEFTEFISRGVSPRYDDSAFAIVINQKCIRNGRLSLEPARRHSTRVPSEKLVRPGDVLVNSTGIGTLGRVAQVREEIPDCTVDTHVSIVRPSSSVDAIYFGQMLLQLESHFDSQGIGATGQTELRRDRIAASKILVPPLCLQGRFSEAVSPLCRLTAGLLKKIINLRTTRDLLLPKLISGELDVSDLDIYVRDTAA